MARFYVETGNTQKIPISLLDEGDGDVVVQVDGISLLRFCAISNRIAIIKNSTEDMSKLQAHGLVNPAGSLNIS